MENGTVQKGKNLLEDFVWPIDTGRLMGDPSYYYSVFRISGIFRQAFCKAGNQSSAFSPYSRSYTYRIQCFS